MSWFRRKPPEPAPPPAQPSRFDPLEVVRGYHQRTKHHPMRYAAALGYLDWETQPDPFRRFDGAPRIALGFGPAPRATYADLLRPGAIAPRPLERAALSSFLLHSLALSAWKSIPEARWSLRVNPSSGNLHPTEGWLLLPALAELAAPGEAPAPALWHYAPKEHALEQRARFDGPTFERLLALLPPGAFLLALSSIPWRESWKYGERAYRYCQHDLGHALGALRLSAALHGWNLELWPGLADPTLERLLGLDRADGGHAGEEESPDGLALVWPDLSPGDPPDSAALHDLLAALAAGARFAGQANRLSSDHQDWDVIPVIDHTCRRGDPARLRRAPTASPSTASDPRAEPCGASHAAPPPAFGSSACPAPSAAPTASEPPEPPSPPALPAAALIRARRSAVSLDRRSSLPRAAFEALLARLVPALSPRPFDALPGPIRVHLALFVHRVEGLTPGLYLLLRAPDGLELLKPRLRPGFAFEPLAGTPPELPLLRLAEGQVGPLAARISCGQDIAADGAFAVAMLADLSGALAADGPPAYRHLHWETGLIGQVLYLEAEAVGLRGTGIGCFFDDELHSALGLADGRVQTLYHFTLGGAVDDPRLSTEPAYAELAPR
jgi:SagB-type dehydrogenase family enzyme